jgi:hypothetical protein
MYGAAGRRNMQFEQHWIFIGFCGALITLLVRLVMHERITLQISLFFIALLTAIMAVAVFPNLTIWVARRMGFALPSNFLFAMGIGALAVLNVATLVTLSRVEQRSIAVTQELGLLRERLDQIARDEPRATSSEVG